MIVCVILVFIAGLIMGSFLNVCIYRIPEGKSIVLPPSSCPGCSRRLGVADLVPVFSYIFLKGRCRYCGMKISPFYMFVELLTAILYTVLFLKYGLDIEFLLMIYITSILIIVLFIDLKHRIIPDELVIAGIAGGIAAVVYNIFKPLEIMGDRNWWNPLVGMVAGSGVLFFVAILGLLVYKSDEVMGMGDVKIFIPIGMFLGWRMTLFALMTAVVIAGVTSFILIVTGIKKRKDTIPFGPFIVIGAITAILPGWDILDFYLKAAFS